MRRMIVVLLGLALLTAQAFCSQPTAAELLKAAKAQALAQHKNIFVMFDASW